MYTLSGWQWSLASYFFSYKEMTYGFRTLWRFECKARHGYEMVSKSPPHEINDLHNRNLSSFKSENSFEEDETGELRVDPPLEG